MKASSPKNSPLKHVLPSHRVSTSVPHDFKTIMLNAYKKSQSVSLPPNKDRKPPCTKSKHLPVSTQKKNQQASGRAPSKSKCEGKKFLCDDAKFEAMEIRYVNGAGESINSSKSRDLPSLNNLDDVHKQTVVVEKMVVTNLLNKTRQVCGERGTSRMSEYMPSDNTSRIDAHSTSSTNSIYFETEQSFVQPNFKVIDQDDDKQTASKMGCVIRRGNKINVDADTENEAGMSWSRECDISSCPGLESQQNVIDEYRQTGSGLSGASTQDTLSLGLGIQQTDIREYHETAPRGSPAQDALYPELVAEETTIDDESRENGISRPPAQDTPYSRLDSQQTIIDEYRQIALNILLQRKKEDEKKRNSDNKRVHCNLIFYEDLLNQKGDKSEREESSLRDSSILKAYSHYRQEEASPQVNKTVNLPPRNAGRLSRVQEQIARHRNRMVKAKENAIEFRKRKDQQMEKKHYLDTTLDPDKSDKAGGKNEDDNIMEQTVKDTESKGLVDAAMDLSCERMNHNREFKDSNYCPADTGYASDFECDVKSQDKVDKTKKNGDQLIRSILKSPTAKAVQALCLFYKDAKKGHIIQQNVTKEPDITVSEILEEYQKLLLDSNQTEWNSVYQNELIAHGKLEKSSKVDQSQTECPKIKSREVKEESPDIQNFRFNENETTKPEKYHQFSNYASMQNKEKYRNEVVPHQKTYKAYVSTRSRDKDKQTMHSTSCSSLPLFQLPRVKPTRKIFSHSCLSNRRSHREINVKGGEKDDFYVNDSLRNQNETMSSDKLDQSLVKTECVERCKTLNTINLQRQNSYSKIHMKRLREYSRQNSEACLNTDHQFSNREHRKKGREICSNQVNRPKDVIPAVLTRPNFSREKLDVISSPCQQNLTDQPQIGKGVKMKPSEKDVPVNNTKKKKNKLAVKHYNHGKIKSSQEKRGGELICESKNRNVESKTSIVLKHDKFNFHPSDDETSKDKSLEIPKRSPKTSTIPGYAEIANAKWQNMLHASFFSSRSKLKCRMACSDTELSNVKVARKELEEGPHNMETNTSVALRSMSDYQQISPHHLVSHKLNSTKREIKTADVVANARGKGLLEKKPPCVSSEYERSSRSNVQKSPSKSHSYRVSNHVTAFEIQVQMKRSPLDVDWMPDCNVKECILEIKNEKGISLTKSDEISENLSPITQSRNANMIRGKTTGGDWKTQVNRDGNGEETQSIAMQSLAENNGLELKTNGSDVEMVNTNDEPLMNKDAYRSSSGEEQSKTKNGTCDETGHTVDTSTPRGMEGNIIHPLQSSPEIRRKSSSCDLIKGTSFASLEFENRADNLLSDASDEKDTSEAISMTFREKTVSNIVQYLSSTASSEATKTLRFNIQATSESCSKSSAREESSSDIPNLENIITNVNDKFDLSKTKRENTTGVSEQEQSSEWGDVTTLSCIDSFTRVNDRESKKYGTVVTTRNALTIVQESYGMENEVSVSRNDISVKSDLGAMTKETKENLCSSQHTSSKTVEPNELINLATETIEITPDPNRLPFPAISQRKECDDRMVREYSGKIISGGQELLDVTIDSLSVEMSKNPKGEQSNVRNRIDQDSTVEQESIRFSPGREVALTTSCPRNQREISFDSRDKSSYLDQTRNMGSVLGCYNALSDKEDLEQNEITALNSPGDKYRAKKRASVFRAPVIESFDNEAIVSGSNLLNKTVDIEQTKSPCPVRMINEDLLGFADMESTDNMSVSIPQTVESIDQTDGQTPVCLIECDSFECFPGMECALSYNDRINGAIRQPNIRENATCFHDRESVDDVVAVCENQKVRINESLSAQNEDKSGDKILDSDVLMNGKCFQSRSDCDADPEMGDQRNNLLCHVNPSPVQKQNALDDDRMLNLLSKSEAKDNYTCQYDSFDKSISPAKDDECIQSDVLSQDYHKTKCSDGVSDNDGCYLSARIDETNGSEISDSNVQRDGKCLQSRLSSSNINFELGAWRRNHHQDDFMCPGVLIPIHGQNPFIYEDSILQQKILSKSELKGDFDYQNISVPKNVQMDGINGDTIRDTDVQRNEISLPNTLLGSCNEYLEMGDQRKNFHEEIALLPETLQGTIEIGKDIAHHSIVKEYGLIDTTVYGNVSEKEAFHENTGNFLLEEYREFLKSDDNVQNINPSDSLNLIDLHHDVTDHRDCMNITDVDLKSKEEPEYNSSIPYGMGNVYDDIPFQKQEDVEINGLDIILPPLEFRNPQNSFSEFEEEGMKKSIVNDVPDEFEMLTLQPILDANVYVPKDQRHSFSSDDAAPEATISGNHDAEFCAYITHENGGERLDTSDSSFFPTSSTSNLSQTSYCDILSSNKIVSHPLGEVRVRENVSDKVCNIQDHSSKPIHKQLNIGDNGSISSASSSQRTIFKNSISKDVCGLLSSNRTENLVTGRKEGERYDSQPVLRFESHIPYLSRSELKVLQEQPLSTSESFPPQIQTTNSEDTFSAFSHQLDSDDTFTTDINKKITSDHKMATDSAPSLAGVADAILHNQCYTKDATTKKEVPEVKEDKSLTSCGLERHTHRKNHSPSQDEIKDSSMDEELSLAKIPNYSIVSSSYGAESSDYSQDSDISTSSFHINKKGVKRLVKSIADITARHFLEVFTSRFITSMVGTLNQQTRNINHQDNVCHCHEKCGNCAACTTGNNQTNLKQPPCNKEIGLQTSLSTGTDDACLVPSQETRDCRELAIHCDSRMKTETYLASAYHIIEEQNIVQQTRIEMKRTTGYGIFKDKCLQEHNDRLSTKTNVIYEKSTEPGLVEQKENMATNRDQRDQHINSGGGISLSSFENFPVQNQIAPIIPRGIPRAVIIDIQTSLSRLNEILHPPGPHDINTSPRKALFFRQESPPPNRIIRKKYFINPLSRQSLRNRPTFNSPLSNFCRQLEETCPPEVIQSHKARSLSDTSLHQTHEKKESLHSYRMFRKTSPKKLAPPLSLGCSSQFCHFVVGNEEIEGDFQNHDKEKKFRFQDVIIPRNHNICFEFRVGNDVSSSTESEELQSESESENSVRNNGQTFKVASEINCCKNPSRRYTDYELDTFVELGSFITEMQSSSTISPYQSKDKSISSETSNDSVIKCKVCQTRMKPKFKRYYACSRCNRSSVSPNRKPTHKDSSKSPLKDGGQSVQVAPSCDDVGQQTVVPLLRADEKQYLSAVASGSVIDVLSSGEEGLDNEEINQTVQYIISIYLLNFLLDVLHSPNDKTSEETAVTPNQGVSTEHDEDTDCGNSSTCSLIELDETPSPGNYKLDLFESMVVADEEVELPQKYAQNAKPLEKPRHSLSSRQFGIRSSGVDNARMKPSLSALEDCFILQKKRELKLQKERPTINVWNEKEPLITPADEVNSLSLDDTNFADNVSWIYDPEVNDAKFVSLFSFSIGTSAKEKEDMANPEYPKVNVNPNLHHRHIDALQDSLRGKLCVSKDALFDYKVSTLSDNSAEIIHNNQCIKFENHSDKKHVKICCPNAGLFTMEALNPHRCNHKDVKAFISDPIEVTRPTCTSSENTNSISSQTCDFGNLKNVLSFESKSLWKRITRLEKNNEFCPKCKEKYSKIIKRLCENNTSQHATISETPNPKSKVPKDTPYSTNDKSNQLYVLSEAHSSRQQCSPLKQSPLFNKCSSPKQHNQNQSTEAGCHDSKNQFESKEDTPLVLPNIAESLPCVPSKESLGHERMSENMPMPMTEPPKRNYSKTNQKIEKSVKNINGVDMYNRMCSEQTKQYTVIDPTESGSKLLEAEKQPKIDALINAAAAFCHGSSKAIQKDQPKTEIKKELLDCRARILKEDESDVYISRLKGILSDMHNKFDNVCPRKSPAFGHARKHTSHIVSIDEDDSSSSKNAPAPFKKSDAGSPFISTFPKKGGLSNSSENFTFNKIACQESANYERRKPEKDNTHKKELLCMETEKKPSLSENANANHRQNFEIRNQAPDTPVCLPLEMYTQACGENVTETKNDHSNVKISNHPSSKIHGKGYEWHDNPTQRQAHPWNSLKLCHSDELISVSTSKVPEYDIPENETIVKSQSFADIVPGNGNNNVRYHQDLMKVCLKPASPFRPSAHTKGKGEPSHGFPVTCGKKVYGQKNSQKEDFACDDLGYLLAVSLNQDGKNICKNFGETERTPLKTDCDVAVSKPEFDTFIYRPSIVETEKPEGLEKGKGLHRLTTNSNILKSTEVGAKHLNILEKCNEKNKDKDDKLKIKKLEHPFYALDKTEDCISNIEIAKKSRSPKEKSPLCHDTHRGMFSNCERIDCPMDDDVYDKHAPTEKSESFPYQSKNTIPLSRSPLSLECEKESYYDYFQDIISENSNSESPNTDHKRSLFVCPRERESKQNCTDEATCHNIGNESSRTLPQQEPLKDNDAMSTGQGQIATLPLSILKGNVSVGDVPKYSAHVEAQLNNVTDNDVPLLFLDTNQLECQTAQNEVATMRDKGLFKVDGLQDEKSPSPRQDRPVDQLDRNNESEMSDQNMPGSRASRKMDIFNTLEKSKLNSAHMAGKRHSLVKKCKPKENQSSDLLSDRECLSKGFDYAVVHEDSEDSVHSFPTDRTSHVIDSDPPQTITTQSPKVHSVSLGGKGETKAFAPVIRQSLVKSCVLKRHLSSDSFSEGKSLSKRVDSPERTFPKHSTCQEYEHLSKNKNLLETSIGHKYILKSTDVLRRHSSSFSQGRVLPYKARNTIETVGKQKLMSTYTPDKNYKHISKNIERADPKVHTSRYKLGLPEVTPKSPFRFDTNKPVTPRTNNSFPVELTPGSPHQIVEEFKRSKARPSQIPVDVYNLHGAQGGKSKTKKRTKGTPEESRRLVISGPVMNMNIPVFRHVVGHNPGHKELNKTMDKNYLHCEEMESKRIESISKHAGEEKSADKHDNASSLSTLKMEELSPRPKRTAVVVETPKPGWKGVIKKIVPFGRKKT